MLNSRAYAGLAIIGVTWGGTIVTTKIAAMGGFHPFGLVFWQQVFTGLALVALLTLTRGAGWIRAAGWRRHFGFFLAIALVGTVVPNSLGYTAAARLPAGVMALVLAMVPMFTLILARFLRMEAPSLRRLAGVALGAVAIAMIVGPEAALPDPEMWPWVLFALLIPMLYAGEGVYVAGRMPEDTDPVVVICASALIGAVITAPTQFFAATRIDIFAPWGEAQWALLIGATLHAGAYSGYVAMVRRSGPVFAALVGYIVTTAGVGWSMALLSEAHSGWFWAALAVLMAGLALVQPTRRAVLAD